VWVDEQRLRGQMQAFGRVRFSKAYAKAVADGPGSGRRKAFPGRPSRYRPPECRAENIPARFRLSASAESEAANNGFGRWRPSGSRRAFGRGRRRARAVKIFSAIRNFPLAQMLEERVLKTERLAFLLPVLRQTALEPEARAASSHRTLRCGAVPAAAT